MQRSEDSTMVASVDSGLSEGIMSLGGLSNLVFTVKDFLEFMKTNACSEVEEYRRLKADLKHGVLELSRSQSHLTSFADHLTQVMTSLDSAAQYLLTAVRTNIDEDVPASHEANSRLEHLARGALVVSELRETCAGVDDVVERRRREISEAERRVEEAREQMRRIKEEEEEARIRAEEEVERQKQLELEKELLLKKEEEERLEEEKRNREMDTMDDSGYDPTNWPLITYQLTLNSNDAVMCDVLCAVRAQPDTLDKMQMKCTLSSPAPVNMCSTPATLERQLSCETTNTTPANQNSDRSSTSYNNNKECFSGDSSNRDDPDFNPELDTGHDSSEDYDPDLDPGHQGGYPLQEGQYQLSNVVCLESKGKPLSFDAPVCIAIPYRMPSGGSLPRDQLLCVLTKEIPVNADVGNPAGKNRPKTARPRASRHTPRSSTSSTSSTRGKAEAEPDTTAANRDKDDEEGDSSDDSSETPEVEWNETTALDITFNEFPMTKFLEIRVRRLHRLLVVAILKQKTDLQWVTARGAKISSSVDSRVAVFVPRKAFKSPQQIHLKVRPVDGAVVNEMKTRYSNNYIISCSPIVTFRVDSGTLPNKPISVSIPCQQTASAQRSCQSRPKSSATVSTSSKTDKSASTSKRPSTAWAGNSKGEEPGEVAVEEDIQVLFQSAGQTTWCQRPASQIKEEMTRVVRDNVLVDIEIAEISIIILKTIGPYSLTELTKNVGQIERQLLENQICFVVRQRDDDTAAVHVECCHSTAVQRTMDNLSREGFTYGPGHSTKVYVEEGDQLMVTFRGNLTFDEEDRMMFTFHKYLKSCRRATYIKEVDRFAQHGFDVYRGHVQLYRVSASAETELLCELPVTLPKPLMEPTVVVRAPVVIADTGPLTKAYFSELSVFIGAEWQLLADKLGIKKARMQNLMRGRSSSRQASIEDMLAHWYKRCPKKMDKVAELYTALCQSGRDDIAGELKERNRQFIERLAEAAENDRLKKAYKVVVSSGRVQSEWKSLALHLSLTDVQIQEIEDQFKENSDEHGGSECRRVRCRLVLDTWRETKGHHKANRKCLLNAVKRMKIITVIDELKNIR